MLRVQSRVEGLKVIWWKNGYRSNWTEHKKAGFTTQALFYSTQKTMFEDTLLKHNKVLLQGFRDTVFLKGVKEDIGVHKDELRTILRSNMVTDILKGVIPDNINKWFDNPEKMPVVQVWAKILWKYKGLSTNTDVNFMH